MTPGLPSDQVAALDLLSQNNLLSGVPVSVLEGIDVAESSGRGGGINPQGYGGFFGLGVAKQYPGGYVIPASELSDPSLAAFVPQAEAAGAEFSSLLAGHSGDVYAAEAAYQGGGTEGTGIFSQMGVPRSAPPGAIVPAAAAASQNAQLISALGGLQPEATTTAGAASSAPGATVQTTGFSLNPFNWPSDLVKGIAKAMALATFVAGGLALVVLGVDRTTGGRLSEAAKTAGQSAGEAGMVAAA